MRALPGPERALPTRPEISSGPSSGALPAGAAETADDGRTAVCARQQGAYRCFGTGPELLCPSTAPPALLVRYRALCRWSCPIRRLGAADGRAAPVCRSPIERDGGPQDLAAPPAVSRICRRTVGMGFRRPHRLFRSTLGPFNDSSPHLPGPSSHQTGGRTSGLRIEYIFISVTSPFLTALLLNVPSYWNPAFSSTRQEAELNANGSA